MKSSPSAKLASSSLLLASLAVSFASLTYPMYVIRPFRRQGARELAAALALLEIRPLVTGVCVILALAAPAWYWRAQQRSRRILAAVGTLLVCTFAALGRVNVFELMFHPNRQPTFSAAQQAAIDPDDEALAVKIGSEAHAYPIRSIAYHHIINDVVNGVPIVATY
jgi:hypothetical protein